MSDLPTLFTEADLGAPMSDSIAVKSNEKFGSSTVGLNCGFFSGCTLYPPFTPGCPPKSKIPKIAGPVWRNKCSRKFVRYQKNMSDLNYMDISQKIRRGFWIRSLTLKLQHVVGFYSFFTILGGHFACSGATTYRRVRMSPWRCW